MLPFPISIDASSPASDQIVAAVKRALASGALKAGDSFPSVREISRELRINPKTAQKAAATLIAENILESRPGLGSVISKDFEHNRKEKRSQLSRMIEELAVESRINGLDLDELKRELEVKWKEFEQ